MYSNILVLLGGDFAQILPVVRRGNRAQTVAACLQQSYIWRYLTVLTLTHNMRMQQGPNSTLFTPWLLKLTYVSDLLGKIRLPSFIQTVKDVTGLYNFVYPSDLL